jgi:hypothetical protein
LLIKNKAKAIADFAATARIRHAQYPRLFRVIRDEAVAVS